jgi:hypothetical protein
MMTNDTKTGVHTTPDPDGTGWVNQGNGVILTHHRKKATAIAAGRRAAKRHGVEFTIHRKDGVVIDTRSYANPSL